MEKLLGILPYIYFDEPIQIGPIKFLNIPDLHGREHGLSDDIRCYLKEISGYFPVLRGLKSETGVIRSFTCFLIDNNYKDDERILVETKKAITLLRYSVLRPEPQKLNDLETCAVYTFEIPPSGNQETRIYHGWINYK